MINKEDASALLSDTLVWMKYAGKKDGEERRETWHEIVKRCESMHLDRFPNLGSQIRAAFDLVRDKRILPSMRSLQFAGRAIEKQNSRIYNCGYLPIDSPLAICEHFFNLLCGTGMGYSVEKQYVSRFPKILSRREYEDLQVETYTIADSIEGWCDAIHALFNSFLNTNVLQKRMYFDFSEIRPRGTPLKTTGGFAPGPDPLRRAIEKITLVLKSSHERNLRPIDVHDILCFLSQAVHAGGVRRSANICFFSNDDEEMLLCKSGQNFFDNPQRVSANNSAVFYRNNTSEAQFRDFMQIVREGKSGEPGIFWTNDPDARSNPCVEASLDPYSFCNLCEINMATVRSAADFYQRCYAAAFIGTLQASYTNFSYLSSRWKEATEKSALIGVSLTGLASFERKKLGFDLFQGAMLVRQTNADFAREISVQPAHRTTLIKPAGTCSLVLGTSSGLHAYHSPFYLRGIEVGKDEPIYPYLMEIMPDNVFDHYIDKETKAFAAFPIMAPPHAVLRSQESAIDLLVRANRYTAQWIVPGHRIGANPHNASITLSIKEHEWSEVTDWMWSHRNEYSGIAMLPYDGGIYEQAPFQEITPDHFAQAMKNIRGTIDFYAIHEKHRSSAIEMNPACAGGTCDI